MIAFLAGMMTLVAAAGVALMVRNADLRDRLVVGLTLTGVALGSIPAALVLAGGEPVALRVASGIPGGDWVIGMDSLSALFTLVMLVVGGACAAYGVPYMRGTGHRDRDRAPVAHAAVSVLIIALAVVVTAQSIVLFLCAWEAMAISSFVLIMTEHEQPEVRRAGVIYLVVTHTATLALFVMFALWTRDADAASDWTFASLAASGVGSGPAAFMLFACAIAAFGIKAGAVPAHFWLPPAHAAAPSHVSAIMSGLVIKTGIYGLLRVVSVAGAVPAWWGWALLGVGMASALLGVLWALAQHDIKRLLAFHSVENIGIICMGLGAGALGVTYGHRGLAALGYGAALLHTVNHALFKSLLFLSAGAVHRVTHTRNLEDLGGLARRMPGTWFAFAVGAVAIIGLPPLNGFVSEWLLFVGLFDAGSAEDSTRLAVLGAPLLAVVGGLALACFAKVAGVVFLGRPRGEAAAGAREVGRGMLIPTWTLAAACIGIGLMAGMVVPPILGVAATVAGLGETADVPLVEDALRGASSVTAFAVFLLVVVALAAVSRRWLIGRVDVRSDDTWGCAYSLTTPRMQYTASSFAAPLIRMFGWLAGVREHRGGTVYHSGARDLVLDDLARPAWRVVQRAALRLRPMQQGRLHLYLLYVVAALIALLLYLVAAPQARP